MNRKVSPRQVHPKNEVELSTLDVTSVDRAFEIPSHRVMDNNQFIKAPASTFSQILKR
jgi:hypothetical protein